MPGQASKPVKLALEMDGQVNPNADDTLANDDVNKVVEAAESPKNDWLAAWTNAAP